MKIVILLLLFACLPALSGCAQGATQEEIARITDAMVKQSYRQPQTSFHERMTIQADVETRDGSPYSFQVSAEMDNDYSGGNFRLYDVSIDGEANLMDLMEKMGGANSAGDIEELYNLFTVAESLEVIFQDKNIYVQASGEWYTMSIDDFFGMSTTGMPAEEREKFDCVMEKSMEDPMSFMGASQFDFSSINMFKDVEKLQPEEVDGVMTDHYRMSYDYEEIVDKMPEMMRATMDPMADLYDECGMEEFRQAMEDSEEIFGGEAGEQIKEVYRLLFENSFSDAWLDDEGNIRRMTYDMRIDLDEFAAAMDDTSADFDGAIVNFKMTEDYSDFGRKFTFDVPATTQPIDVLFQGLFGSEFMPPSGTGPVTPPPGVTPQALSPLS